MNEAEFNQLVDDLMFSIEVSIDDSGADMDYENSSPHGITSDSKGLR